MVTLLNRDSAPLKRRDRGLPAFTEPPSCKTSAFAISVAEAGGDSGKLRRDGTASREASAYARLRRDKTAGGKRM